VGTVRRPAPVPTWSRRQAVLSPAVRTALARVGAWGVWPPLLRSWAVLLGIGCAAVVVRDAGVIPGDLDGFAAAGATLWSDRALDAYRNPWVQAGPAVLTLYRATTLVERALGLPPYLVASVVTQVVVVFGTVGLAALPFRLCGRATPRSVLLVVGSAALLLDLGTELHQWAHLSQFLVAGVWVAATLAATQGRPATVGLLLALSVAFEPWGALGFPIVLALPTAPAGLRAAAVGLAGAGAVWAPFAFWGDFQMLDFRWAVAEESALAPILGAGSPFGWPLRLLQAVGVTVVAVICARLLRQGVQRLWVLPLAILATRLLLDPRALSYYRVPVMVLALMAGAALLAEAHPRRGAVMVALYPSLLVTVPLLVCSGSALLGVALAVTPLALSPSAGIPQVLSGTRRT